MGLFGWHLVTASDRSVVLTADEWDAMAVSQGARRLALALPKGPPMANQVLLLAQGETKKADNKPTSQRRL